LTRLLTAERERITRGEVNAAELATGDKAGKPPAASSRSMRPRTRSSPASC